MEGRMEDIRKVKVRYEEMKGALALVFKKKRYMYTLQTDYSLMPDGHAR